jgi:aminopeptidase N
MLGYLMLKILCWLAPLLAFALPRVTWAAEREHLPSGVTPLHYDLSLIPDVEHRSFSGQVQITIAVSTATPSIVLNADELVLDKAVLDGKQAAAAITLDTALQRATIRFGQPVATGSHSLVIHYHGAIGKSTIGFFAMDYDSPAGKRRTIATNFEPAGERRFMPSWDEPALKATLSLTVNVPTDRMAVANMPIASTETMGNGKKRVRFATTPKMSTYLYFLGIGDFERVSTKVDGTEVGVVVNRGDTKKGSYALGEAARLLHYYNNYFGVAYPLPKLDLVVAPGSITGGSMENWGAIFYSQSDLLFDPKLSTEADRQGVFLVVSHEMAHQWFGDLVTMAWWDNLWLNEGFARWMQTKAADDLHPQWKTGLQALEIAEHGKRADAKSSTHPIVQTVLNANQAEQAFDAITYDKGAAVIGMLEAYVGAAAFRDGVRRYMHAHAYGNTVDADLWREVQAAAGKPVLEMEADFTTQPGVPLLRVEKERAAGPQIKLVLSQGRFAEDPLTIAHAPVQAWRIPVSVNAGGESKTYLLAGPAVTKLTIPDRGAVIVNAGQSSYARTLYPNSMIEALTTTIGTVKAADQLGILHDSWALGQSGYAPVTNYLDLARSIPVQADPIVWLQVVSTLVQIDRLYQGRSNHAVFLAFGRERLRPIAAHLGWDAQTKEDANNAKLRAAVLQALSRFEDQGVITQARQRFDLALDESKDVSPAMRHTVISIAARHADTSTLDRLLAVARTTKDPLKKENLFGALGQIADPRGAERVLEAGMGPDAPAGLAPYLFMDVALDHPDLVWKRALQYFDRPGAPLDSQMRLFLMPAIARCSSDHNRLTDLQAYADQHIPANARQSVESAIATIKLNAKFRSERLPEIDKWLAGRMTH